MYQTAWCHIPEYSNLHINCHENHIFHVVVIIVIVVVLILVTVIYLGFHD
jgi:uncharacterized protein YqhQ